MGWLERLFQAIAREGPAPATPETGRRPPMAIPAGMDEAAGQALREALTRTRYVSAELTQLRPWGPVTPEALDELRRHYRERSAEIGAALMAPAGARGLSLQEFLADRSILIVSYAPAPPWCWGAPPAGAGPGHSPSSPW